MQFIFYFKHVLKEAMNVNKDNPLLKVYASTQEQLDDVTKQYNLEKQNVLKFYILVKLISTT